VITILSQAKFSNQTVTGSRKVYDMDNPPYSESQTKVYALVCCRQLFRGSLFGDNITFLKNKIEPLNNSIAIPEKTQIHTSTTQIKNDM